MKSWQEFLAQEVARQPHRVHSAPFDWKKEGHYLFAMELEEPEKNKKPLLGVVIYW